MTKKTITSAPAVKRDTSGGQILGRTSDGVRIMKPKFSPTSFTVKQMQSAISKLPKRVGVS
jgi:hypothetical protein